MSIRTTVTLDDDVRERVLLESRTRGASFRNTLNDLLRTALLKPANRGQREPFVVRPSHMGQYPGLNYDSIESLLECGEGAFHR